MIPSLLIQSIVALNMLSASGNVTIPESIRIYYDYSAFGVLKEEPDDVKSFMKQYQFMLDYKEEYIREQIDFILRELNDPSVSDDNKLDYVKLKLKDLKKSRYGMVSIPPYKNSTLEKVARRLCDLEKSQCITEQPKEWDTDTYYVVMLDYKERTDTLSMGERDDLKIQYKGKYYRSSPIFFLILDIIRDLDPTWREVNDYFYKGHGNINYDVIRLDQ